MTDGVPAQRLRRIRLTATQRILLLTACMAAVALALFAGAVRELPPVSSGLPLPWLLWVAAFTISETLVVHVQWQRDAHTFSMTDLVLAAGLLLATPQELVTAQVVGYAVALFAWRRQRGLKLAFNVALSALGGGLATIVYSITSGPGGVWDWVAALLAVLAVTLTSDVCIFAAISISEGRTRLRALYDMAALSVPFTLGSATLGLVLARSAAEDPPALALLALPAVLLVSAYRASNGARQQQ